MIKSSTQKILPILLLSVVFLTGLVSCGNDDDSSVDSWKFVSNFKDEKGQYVDVYIDLKNMEIEGKIRKFWIRYYADKISGEDSDQYIRQTGYWEVDCQDRTLHVLEEKGYGTEGQVLGGRKERVKEEYAEGSLGDKLASVACRYAGRN